MRRRRGLYVFEGFAIYAAGQFLNYSLSPDEIWKIVESSEKGSYKKYGAVFRYFSERIPIHELNELIKHAGYKDFLEWLKQIEHK